MADQGTRNLSLAFGDFVLPLSLVKAKHSRDLKTEYVNSEGVKVTSGAGRGRVPEGTQKAVRLSEQHVVRLPAERLEAIEATSKERWGQMQVLEAIDYRSVPTERIEGSYWLQPAQGSAQGLFLLHVALSARGRVAVVKWCSSTREKLGVIRPRTVHGKRALLLSELAFANDFREPDGDVLAINEAEAQMDPVIRDRSIAQACGLIDAFSRQAGDEHFVDTASDEAVDARLALLERLQAEALTAALEFSPDDGGSGEVVDIDAARNAA